MSATSAFALPARGAVAAKARPAEEGQLDKMFASVEHRLLHSWYSEESDVARALLWGGALGDWPAATPPKGPSQEDGETPLQLMELDGEQELRDELGKLEYMWKKPPRQIPARYSTETQEPDFISTQGNNMVGAIAKLLASDSRPAYKKRLRFGLEATCCRKPPATVAAAWDDLKTGLHRKFCLPDHPEFREVLLSTGEDGELPILVEFDPEAVRRPSFWAGYVDRVRIYGRNTFGVLLSKVRAALLWSLARDEEDLRLSSEAAALYFAGLGWVEESPDANLAITAADLLDFEAPIPSAEALRSLGLKEIPMRGYRPLSPLEREKPILSFRAKSRLPAALLSNFAHVPWGA